MQSVHMREKNEGIGVDRKKERRKQGLATWMAHLITKGASEQGRRVKSKLPALFG